MASGISPSLHERRPGQLLWCHACNWTKNAFVAPDVITYFHQATSPPWGERLRFAGEGRKFEKEPALAGSPDDVAATIHATLPASSAPADLALLTLTEHTLPFETSGRRTWFRTDSPVKSSRFF